MNARQVAEQLIQRSRDLMVLTEDQDEQGTKAALNDLTMDFGKQVADHLSQMVEQNKWAHHSRRLRIVRDHRTLWRAVCRHTKAAYPTHPINERHFSASVAAYHWQVYFQHESLFDTYFSPVHRRQLSMAVHGHPRSVIAEVVSHYG